MVRNPAWRKRFIRSVSCCARIPCASLLPISFSTPSAWSARSLIKKGTPWKGAPASSEAARGSGKSSMMALISGLSSSAASMAHFSASSRLISLLRISSAIPRPS